MFLRSTNAIGRARTPVSGAIRPTLCLNCHQRPRLGLQRTLGGRCLRELLRRRAAVRASDGASRSSTRQPIIQHRSLKDCSGRTEIAALPIGGVSWQVPAGHNRRPPREDPRAVPALLAPPNRPVARLPDCVHRELGVCGFEFLKAHDVGLGFAKPAEQVRQRRLMLLMLKLAIFIRAKIEVKSICWTYGALIGADQSRLISKSNGYCVALNHDVRQFQCYGDVGRVPCAGLVMGRGGEVSTVGKMRVPVCLYCS